MKISFSKGEQDLLEGIKMQETGAMEEVYTRNRSEFISWSQKNHRLNEEQAIDLYQEIITLFFEKVISGSLSDLTSTIKTYLFGMAKNKILQSYDVQSRHGKHEEAVAEHFKFLSESDELLGVYEKAKETTEKMFTSMGEMCRKLLRLFYYDKKSMSEIAEIMGHKNDGVTRTTKKRCLEKVRGEVLKSSEE